MKKKNIQIHKKNLKNIPEIEFIKGNPNELFLMVWEITKDMYSFVEGKDAERRLQRDVVSIYRKQS